jgi:ketosteroid isomerase-like protein
VAGENAAIVRGGFEAFENGDIEDVLARFDEDVVIRQPPELFDAPSTQRGHAGVLEAFAIWPEQWDDFRVEILDIEEHGDQVLVKSLNHGRSKDSGIEVATRFSFVFRVRDGRITHWRIYVREEEALEALSASRPRGSP